MANVIPQEVIEQRFNEMINLWQKYINLFDLALETEDYSHDQQEEFLKLQLDITRRAQLLRIAIPENLFDVWKDMKKLLLQTPTIDILKKEAPIKISNLRSIWHEVSISLKQKQGHLNAVLQEKEEAKSKRKFFKK